MALFDRKTVDRLPRDLTPEFAVALGRLIWDYDPKGLQTIGVSQCDSGLPRRIGDTGKERTKSFVPMQWYYLPDLNQQVLLGYCAKRHLLLYQIEALNFNIDAVTAF